jgi:hypothetical protein
MNLYLEEKLLIQEARSYLEEISLNYIKMIS